MQPIMPPSSPSSLSSQNDDDLNEFPDIDINSHRYNSLLEEISSLQTDLQNTKAAAAKLSTEHQSLQQEHQQSKLQLTNLRNRLDESKKALQEHVKAACLREKEGQGDLGLAALESKWRAVVEKEREEIEDTHRELMEKMVDLERMREQIRHEVCKEYDVKLEAVRQEMEGEKEKQYEINKEYEVYKTKQDIALTAALRNAETAFKARENDAVAFTSKINILMESERASSQKSRSLSLEMKEYKMHIKHMRQVEDALRSEVREALQDKNRSDAALMDAESRHSIKVKELQARQVLVDTEATDLRAEVKSLRNDLESSNLELIDVQDQLHRTEETLKTEKKSSKEKDKKNEDFIESMSLNTQRLDNQLKTEQSMFKEEKRLMNQQREKLQAELEDCRAAVQKLKGDAISSEERAKRQLQVELHGFAVKNTTLEKKITMLKSDLMLKTAESECTIRNLERSLEICQHEVNGMAKKNYSLQSENKLANEMARGLKEQVLEVQARLEETLENKSKIQSALNVSENKVKDLITQNQLTSSHLETQAKELLRAKKAERETQASIKRSKALVQKEKRKANAYKQKALEAHTKNLQAKQLLKTMPK